MADEYPKSWQVGIWRTAKKDYTITAGGWAPDSDTVSYEIGVRMMSDWKTLGFALIQGDWGLDQVKLAGAAITLLLENGWGVDSIREIFP